MKKVFYAVSLLLGLSVLFSSCEKSGKNEESFIVGNWTYEDWGGYGVDEYLEYTNTGRVKVYWNADYKIYGDATFKDGVLSYPGEWELDYVYDYYFEDGLYWDEEYETCEFEIINKDKFSLSWTNSKGNRMTETFVRIKKFTK